MKEMSGLYDSRTRARLSRMGRHSQNAAPSLRLAANNTGLPPGKTKSNALTCQGGNIMFLFVLTIAAGAGTFALNGGMENPAYSAFASLVAMFIVLVQAALFRAYWQMPPDPADEQ